LVTESRQFLYILCQMFIKLSYLFFYLRHAITTTSRVVLYGFIALVTGFGISTSIVSMMLCIPFAKLLRPNLPGKCIDIKKYYISTLTLNIFLDLTIFILPIPILWKLRCRQEDPYNRTPLITLDSTYEAATRLSMYIWSRAYVSINTSESTQK